MAIKLEDKPNVGAPDSSFPFGDFKDNTGSNNGTPLNRFVLSDYLQFFHKMMDVAGITYNNELDSEDNGFQFFEALGGNVVKKYTKEITSNFDGAVVTITRSEIETAFGNLNPFYKGALGASTTESPFTDIHVKVYFLDTGLWKDFEDTGNLNTSISESTGDITLVLDAAPVSGLRTRIVIIG